MQTERRRIEMKANIAKLEPDATKWEIVAHGARWEWADAEDFAASLRARGCEAMLLPVATEED